MVWGSDPFTQKHSSFLPFVVTFQTSAWRGSRGCVAVCAWRRPTARVSSGLLVWGGISCNTRQAASPSTFTYVCYKSNRSMAEVESREGFWSVNLEICTYFRAKGHNIITANSLFNSNCWAELYSHVILFHSPLSSCKSNKGISPCNTSSWPWPLPYMTLNFNRFHPQTMIDLYPAKNDLQILICQLKVEHPLIAFIVWFHALTNLMSIQIFLCP